jgi:DNA-directed RNA polymerase specialized sigma24 family protein
MMTRETYGEVYQEGKERTIRFLLSRGVTRTLAPDIAQSAWLRGWERLSQLRDERMLVTWVNTIALNQYRRAIRTERLQKSIQDAGYPRTSLNLAAIDVAKVLHMCRGPERALLEAQMHGVTAKEMAREQGVSETAVRIRFFRARRSARLALQTSHARSNGRVRRSARAVAA